MSELVKVYVEEVAEGRVPNQDSEEAKEYRAWSWAQEQLRQIKASADWEIGFEAEMMEQENGEMYR